MALFKKKVKVEEPKKAEEKVLPLAKERILFEEITGEDYRTKVLVDSLKKGNPLVLNFEHIDVTAGNKVLAFISGAAYALNGKTIAIDEKIFLFARGEDFIDGSLESFLRELKNS